MFNCDLLTNYKPAAGAILAAFSVEVYVSIGTIAAMITGGILTLGAEVVILVLIMDRKRRKP